MAATTTTTTTTTDKLLLAVVTPVTLGGAITEDFNNALQRLGDLSQFV